MSRRASLQPDRRDLLAQLLTDPKFELIPLKNTLEQASRLPAGAKLTVTASPTKSLGATFELAEQLAGLGYSVIPHLSARQVTDRSHLRQLLERCEVAGIDRLFVVGGDATEPGAYPDALSLLRHMAESGHHLKEIGVAGYPEGHAFIPEPALMDALIKKQSFANYVTSQMCFDPGAVIRWVGRLRSSGVTLPLHVGVPGVSDVARLLRVAAKVGVGDSLRYLRQNKGILGLIRPGAYRPAVFLGELVGAPNLDLEALHIFTFNQVEATLAWRERLIKRA